MNTYNRRYRFVRRFRQKGSVKLIRDWKIRTKLLVVYLALFIAVLLPLGITQYIYLKQSIRTSIENELNNTTRMIQDMVESSVDMAIRSYLRAVAEKNRDIARSFYERSRRGEISVEEARRLMVKIFGSQTIGKTGYLYCINSKGAVFVHPKKNQLESDVTRYDIVRQQIDLKEGFISYNWKNPGEERERPKALYMTYFEPWDLIISVTSYRDEFTELVRVDDFRDRILGLRFGKTGYSYILDSQGKLILHPMVITGDYIDARDINGKPFVQEMCRNKSGKIVYSWKNPGELIPRTKVVIYNNIKELGWIVASSGYVDEFYEPLVILKRVFLAGFAVAFVLIIIVNMALSSYITAPLRDLVEKFKMAGSGNMSVAMPVGGVDELGELARCFNLFIQRLGELKKKDEQLIRIQKMEAMSYVAGGLAHDFNNMLAGIIGSVSILQYHFAEGGDTCSEESRELIVSSLNTIENAAHRAADMAGRLLTMSRKKEIRIVPVDLNMSVKNVVSICRNTFDKQVVIDALYDPDRVMVMADPTQVEQVILNLCINAEHAMTMMRRDGEKKGGILSLKTGRLYADESFCREHPEAASRSYVLFEVGDTGVGMSMDVQRRIFDPFFSTKGEGRGTGLGLSMVCGIINRVGGFITVKSVPGNGTVFTIYLPEVYSAEQPLVTDRKNTDDLSGSGLVLVIDDENIILKTAETILKDHGYEVITALSGDEGLAVFREKHESISVVVLDMAMPGLSGREVYQRMRVINPSVKVILSSGIEESGFVKKARDLGIFDFIHKPYAMMDLLRIVSQAVCESEFSDNSNSSL